ncbi:acyltransferase family protein [Paraburkholderia saeva]|uniref:Acyltransferase 3 domain-containing protein n=1 Tax=Paraburkholderia saeva TaxID=2777537 RepID=A0A9N8RUP7_9BURK|nr:acyltransferase [Paraburkholderia saeva]CAG4887419.1 hypothetical protein R52603_00423 [Paraburkholderia saeva]CAG4894989.1 hypothetical protein LMG31841_02043 [Paraburkholderia saeva]CAG4898070.1 hypothetical protein R70241_02422 [Paraburkholderia saeva]
MKLAHAALGRKDENNFNLLRIIAALAVLFSHSFALVTGDTEAEPLVKAIGMTPGTMAVDVFFVTSGFLVTKSLLTRKNVFEFLWARCLRIYPALFVMLVLLVLGVGVTFTTLPAAVFLADHQTWHFVAKTAILVSGSVFDLPGVFTTNPYPNTVNGSLWTMMYEIRMYLVLAMLWVGAIVAFSARSKFFRASVLAVAALSLLYWFHTIIAHHVGQKSHLPWVFFAGASFYVMKDRVSLSGKTCLLIAAVVAVLGFAQTGYVFTIAYMIVVPYLVLTAAYYPSGALFRYNRLGDYSYGVYIYAFPIQQSIVALFPGISIAGMIVSSTLVTLVFAVLSWHLIEKRALRLKDHLVGATMRVLRQAS